MSTKHLTVTCGGRAVYDSADELNGTSMMRSGFEEDAGEAPGTQVYAIEYVDKGSRSGKRSEVAIDSVKHLAAVWNDNLPSYRVEMTMPYQSDPAKGPALRTSTTHALRRAGVVKETSGAGPVKAGAKCSVRATPLGDKASQCLVRVRCGAEMLYGKGTTGVAGCTVEGDEVRTATDTNPTSQGGDPELDLDVEKNKVVVADEVGQTKWSVTVALDPK